MFIDPANSQPFFKATYWTQAGGLRALEDVLAQDHGLDLSGFSPWLAGSISADGLTITGYGLDSHAKARGFVAVLPGPCGGTASFCTSSPNSAGAGALMDWSGSTSIAGNDLTLEVNGASASQFGIFYYGPNQVSIPFGDGFRCVGGGTYRLPVLSTDASGFGTYTMDYTNPPKPSAQISSGDLWNFQFWYRDPQQPGGSGYNLSDGLQISFCP
ncbi:MAG: hypothetical protein ACI841_000466 [Planctomycetota bacterium]|jgi:hypothetical protein